MAKKQTEQNGRHSVDLHISIGDVDAAGYHQECSTRGGHMEAQLDAVQYAALRRLYNGLNSARLANGKRIASNADVVRYLLEQVAAAEVA